MKNSITVKAHTKKVAGQTIKVPKHTRALKTISPHMKKPLDENYHQRKAAYHTKMAHKHSLPLTNGGRRLTEQGRHHDDFAKYHASKIAKPKAVHPLKSLAKKVGSWFK